MLYILKKNIGQKYNKIPIVKMHHLEEKATFWKKPDLRNLAECCEPYFPNKNRSGISKRALHDFSLWSMPLNTSVSQFC